VTTASVDIFDASRHWQLSEQVSLRDEAFGALAYHHVNRRLVFLKSRELVSLVRCLGEYVTAEQAVTSLVDDNQREQYLSALAALAQSGLLREG